ncbi:MAG: hypothetical protein ACHQ4H_05225 [Ktedonobacterales bacterium]
MTQRLIPHPSVLGFMRQEVGQAMRHLIAAVLLAFVCGAFAVEAVGMALTHTWPTLPTHLAAGVVALALGYAAAITVLFRVLLRAIGRSAESVTNEIEQATKRVLRESEPSPLAGRARMYANSIVSSTLVQATPGATLEDGVLAGLRPD